MAMVIGLKGDSAKLKNLYKELELKEVKPNTFEELEEAVKNIDGQTVILNYNEIMVFDKPTADLVEKRTKVLSAVSRCKNNIFLALTKADNSLDKIHLDLSICTAVNTKDMKLIEEIYNFCNTDLPYSGKLSDGKYAVRVHGDNRAEEKSISDIKSLIK